MEIFFITFFVAIVLGALFVTPKFFGKGKPKVTQESLPKKVSTIFTREEVAEHNKRNDCWIIVKDKVYDVTPYVEEHPGGDAILNNAGRDSTEGFYGPQHATRVFDMVDEFYVGDLKI